MGVGGAIDVVAGVTRRAPRWVQRLGLEWLTACCRSRADVRPLRAHEHRFIWLLARELVRKGHA